jgi:hypothetical protein
MAARAMIFEHISDVVLENSEAVKESLNNAGIRTYKRLLDVRRNSDLFNALKFKDPETQQMVDLPDELKEEILDIKNYLNWLQNNHGTIKNCPIDVIKDTSRESFEHFLSMDPEERGGKDDGTVWYDVKAARESEEFNKIGAFAPTVAPVVPTQSGRTSITSS